MAPSSPQIETQSTQFQSASNASESSFKQRTLGEIIASERSERMRKIIQRDVDGFKGYTTHRPGYDTGFFGPISSSTPPWRRGSPSNIKSYDLRIISSPQIT
ncbi:hypothetical protein LENED_003078 [Lentinula edodes]|uniref:Uncharacterized protein n=1 Tax=Lentinula edodes TaxID=5353 RepID=A0A1Q3E2J4_LENED|nr:hypothetical protein LENED_003078 [Lentinula edodes]